MEITRRYVSCYSSPQAAYLALQCALMRRFVASGGTAEEFCTRLAPAYRRRFGPLFFGVGWES